MSLKNRDTLNPLNSHNYNFSSSYNNFNSFSNLNNFASSNLIKNKTPPYQISIPIINRFKDVTSSNSVILRCCCSKIADLIKESLDCVKLFKFDESLMKLYQCKSLFEQTFKNQTNLIKYIKFFSDLNNTSSINLNMNNVHFLNMTKLNYSHTINNLNNTSISNDDSLYELVKNINSSNISKIFNFCFLILNDINSLIEKIKNRNFNCISELFTIKQSLMFYRPVHLSDERFLDDVIEA